MSNYGLLLSVAIPLFVFGCNRAPSASTSSSSPNSADTAAVTQVQAGPASVKAPAAPAPAGEAVNLDREVRKWIVRNQRPPKSFEDFAATAGIEIPPPPAGKKYVLDKTMHVVLANR